ncbi:MAG: M48 family metalloprotease [Candidatus Marsarchaeota archaeon]|nr:M48 family metalloprotease [Candidatus Marsarchaeota archaeon]
MNILTILINCIILYISSPVYLLILIGIAALAISTFVLLKTGRLSTYRVAILGYVHFMALLFPFIFFASTMSCVQLGECNIISTAGYSLIIVLPIAAVAYYLFIPYLFKVIYGARKIKKGMIYTRLKWLSKSLDLKLPKLFLIDGSTPNAFSVSGFHSSIFLSVGVFEIMNKKEIDAILIHELNHIASASSILKPLAWFAGRLHLEYLHSILVSVLRNEEHSADHLSCVMQGTSIYLKSAKMKVHY